MVENDKAKLLAQQALDALAQREVKTACPRCSFEKWRAEVYGALVMPLPAMGGFMMPPPYAPVLSLTCQRCGFMSFHSLNLLGIKL